MTGKVHHYYAGGNTAKGFYSLYDSVLQDLQRLYILKGGPGTGKSSLMKHVGQIMEEKGYDVEYLHCASDNKSIDGVILPNEGLGIVDGTAPHVIEPNAPGVIEEYVNIGVAWDSNKLSQHKEKILTLNQEISKKFNQAYETFAASLRAHDDIEDIYISNMDFAKANQLTDEIISLFYGEEELDKKPRVQHRFLGAATPDGAVDFIQNLTEDIEKRYFIKGRAGSGKSTMLKKIVAAGEQRGFDVEVYHCGFDPNSLDMVILREKGIAIFDSTAPHEYFPERNSDEIIDMYERCITPGTDEKYAEDIARTTKAYKDKMKEAISYLAEAKQLRDQLESYYIEAMDFKKIDAIREELTEEIKTFLEQNE
ncbi:PRK06851 family protein [Metabacillus litoralis]|uniref:PRK06851 family protein n=1 Tax=Metabacillus TaxID=2675233 RepID=UPI001B907596|nr:PRK06851 family protein [Metabacillus litoralis]MCM3164020.1 PRK06851 family protein [Metabacillus litoralis]MCM3410510.1 PRK06851 family protein [Metabacillus litoralis]UHA58396.1 PRK06851 family protein [Metabacillus litoralis]